MSGSGRQEAAKKFNDSIEDLRQNWEGYHLLEFTNNILFKNKENEKKRLDDILDSYGLGSLLTLQKLPSSKKSAFTLRNSNFIFESLAEFLDIPLLSCFLRFLEFCRDSNPPRPLKVFEEDNLLFVVIRNEKIPVTLDYAINDIKKHIKNEEEKFKEKEQPQLTLPEAKEGNINYYANIAHPLIGRDDQKKRLIEFLNYSPENSKIAWFQLAGVAGQGKSRLALDLISDLDKKDIKEELGLWRAGFLTDTGITSFQDCLDNWEPSKHLLLIFDYVVGREEKIKSILQRLIQRDQKKKFLHKIRILLLERQRWDHGIVLNKHDLNAQSEIRFLENISDKAEWFLKLCAENDLDEDEIKRFRFENGVEELKKLHPNDLVIIVKELLTKLNVKTLTLSDNVLKETLERIDDAGRPLYAYLLAQQLSVTEEGYQSWTKIDLLNYQLARDKKRWKKVFEEQKLIPPTWGESHPAMKLAVLATIVRQVTFGDVQIKQHFGNIDLPLRKEAIFISSGYLINKDDYPQQIFAMEPDLLGEWFVLFCFYRGLEFEELLNLAWQYSPEDTAVFLHRITQDFIDIPEKYNKWYLINMLLAHKPFDENHYQALAEVAVAITYKLYQKDLAIPRNILVALEYAATFDFNAMNFLGYFYLHGIGYNINPEKAFHLFQQAIQHGNDEALVNVGVCYHNGIGVDLDSKEAINYYRRAIEKQNYTAMGFLGVCYQKGFGVEQNWSKAFDLYQSAVDLGNETALAFLGYCYEKGKGTKQDLDKAIQLYKHGVEKSNSKAMAYLGFCYQYGISVDQSWSHAFDLYCRAIERGDDTAMFNLGVCYQKGLYVKKDCELAVNLFWGAVEKGNSSAMVNLGLCYHTGEGVEQNRNQAIELYFSAAKRNNDSAIALLGFCYEKGDGVIQNLPESIKLYQRAADLGNSKAMLNLGLCYQNAVGAEQNWNLAANLYKQALIMGEERANNLIQDMLLINFLGEGNYVSSNKNLLISDEFPCLNAVPIFDCPIISGHWKYFTFNELNPYLNQLKISLEILDLIESLGGHLWQYARYLVLDFYKDCILVDIQIHDPSKNDTCIFSAIFNKERVLLPYGKADIIYRINPHLLSFKKQNSSINYLQFIFSFNLIDLKPLQIISNLNEIPFKEASQYLQDKIADSFFIPRIVDGIFDQDGWQKIEAWVLLRDILSIYTFKIFSNGMVIFEENDECIFVNLPVLQRQYDGIFRTPLRAIS